MEGSSLKYASFLVGVLATVLYLNTLKLGFCFDDLPAIVNNKDLRSTTPWLKLFENDFWGTPMSLERSHKSYRPLTVATFRLNYAAHELSGAGYHLMNAIIHGLVSALFVVFSHVVFGNVGSSLLAGLLFACQPIHTEAVAGLVGRAEGLCSLFFMSAFLAYLKAAKTNRTDSKWLLLSLAATVAAVLSKELGVTVIGVCLVYDFFAIQKVSLPIIFDTLRQGHKPQWRTSFLTRLVIMLGAAVVIMALRLRIMKNVPIFLPFDNPPAFAVTPARQLTQLHLVFLNAWLLLCPAGLLADWSMGTVPLIYSFVDPRNFLTLMVFVLLAAVGFTAISGTSRKNRILVLAVAMLMIPFIPASNLLFSVGFVIAERILYIPSMGFCILVALGLECLLQKKYLRHLCYVFFLLLILLFSGKTFVRNYQWDSDFTIFSSALKVTQSNAKVYSNIGHHYENKGDYKTAEEYFSQSVVVQPDDIGAWMNVGRINKHLKNRTAAMEAYRKAISFMPKLTPGTKMRVAPNHLQAYTKLASLLNEEKNYVEAIKVFKSGLSVDRMNAETYNGYGEALRELGRFDEARERFHQALAIKPDSYVTNFHLGVLGLRSGNAKDAERYFKKVVQIDPTHTNAFFNLGVLLSKNNRLSEAEKFLRQAFTLDSKHTGVLFSLSVVLLDLGRPMESLEFINKTLEIDPTHREAMFNYGLVLKDTGRTEEALVATRHFLGIHPDHLKGHLIMGDITANANNFKEALEWYNKALQISPGHILAMHNKAVVLANLQQTEEALKIMEVVVQKEPDHPNAQLHLQHMRQQISNARKSSP